MKANPKKCNICKHNKIDIKIFSGMELCADCRKEMTTTLVCLRISTNWMLRKFDTHERTSKSFVLRPKRTRS